MLSNIDAKKQAIPKWVIYAYYPVRQGWRLVPLQGVFSRI
jgi:hypothetical protein